MRKSVVPYVRLAMLAVFTVAWVVADARPPDFVYRGVDAPRPDQVFAHGFPSPGHNQDILSHVNGLSCENGETAFVSTTASEAFAYERALYAMATNPSGEFYVYRIRADPNFYSTDLSLRGAHGHAWYQQLRNTADTYFHQEEWVAHRGIPASQVESVSVYRLSLETGQLEHVGVRRNPGYIELETRASDVPFPVAARTPDSRRVIVPSFSYPLVSACFGCMGSQSERRSMRAVDAAPPSASCKPYAVSTVTAPVTVIDPISGKRVSRYVPWRTWRRNNHLASFMGPVDCDIMPNKRVLTVNCAQLPGVAQFSVHLGAGGSRYTWVDRRYDDGVVGKLWGLLPSGIPVKGTRYTLGDYGYDLWSVFSGNDGSWWSAVTVLPVFPMLQQHTDDICLYKDAGFAGLFGCVGWNVRGARLVPGVNDQISAIRASKRARYQVCDDFDFGGRCFVLQGSADFVKLNALGINDRISSIRACNKPMPNTWQPPPRNRGVIGSIFAFDNPASGKREFYRLAASTYGPFPASRQGNRDWVRLEEYEEC